MLLSVISNPTHLQSNFLAPLFQWDSIPVMEYVVPIRNPQRADTLCLQIVRTVKSWKLKSRRFYPVYSYSLIVLIHLITILCA